MQCNPAKEPETLPASYSMRRQDSGYESMTPASPQSQTRSRRRSSVSVASYGSRTRNRPPVRRAPKSSPVVYIPREGPPKLRTETCCQGYQQRPIDTPRFPHSAARHHGLPLDATAAQDTLACGAGTYATDSIYTPDQASPPSCTVTYAPPPQTTHYWTSDRTRRLEYAAIDAASRGVRGWVMRHMVPGCFIPEDCRRLRFDDDRGSVVRYRLHLDGDDRSQNGSAKSTKKRKSWWFGTSPS